MTNAELGHHFLPTDSLKGYFVSRSDKIKEQIAQNKIVVIFRNVDIDDVLPVAEALIDGGIRLIEVTFDQADPTSWQDTTHAIALLNQKLGQQICVGAGTVLTVQQVNMALEAGAEYVISPNFNIPVVRRTIELDAVAIPGVYTPTEMVAAYEAGASFVKLFPAESLGLSYIKAVMAPLSHLPILAVGGVNEINLKEFLAAGVAGVGIGSNIVKRNLITEKRFSDLTSLARQYTSQID